jgi:hypothetical protein|tara:strand:- start:7889 stop:8383 length:495 start_codon:yes stop_codon:yes gene_type:complete
MAKNRSNAQGTPPKPLVSIPLPQKEFQKVKKTTEKHIVNLGGSFLDTQGNKGVRSTYTLGGNIEKYAWHKTYSDVRSLRNTKGDVFNLLLSLGVMEKMGLEGFSKSSVRSKLKLRKRTPIDGELMFPPEFRDLEKALDELLSKTPAEYEADEANEELDRLSRFW